AGDGDVDGHPGALGAGAQPEAVLAVEDAGAAGRLAQPLLAAGGAGAAAGGEAEVVGRGPAQHLLAAEAAEPLSRRVDLEQLVGFGVEEEQGVAGLLEQRLPEPFDVGDIHGRAVPRGASGERRRRPASAVPAPLRYPYAAAAR